jgi:GcrA cell cycle regulator
VKWTDEMDAVLRRCRLDGLSCSASAAVIRKEIGVSVSRNAVIGRACRLGLPSIDHTLTKSRAARRNRTKSKLSATRIAPAKKQPKPLSFVPTTAEPIPEPAEDDIPTKTFDELEWNDGCCRWRVDRSYKDRPYGFCAKEALPGLTFCESHARRAYANWSEVQHKYVEVKEKAKEAETA